jgi:tripartite-type tricarboxylate transporter receptor subunit TctC
MPPSIVARLHAELLKALAAPDIHSRIVDDGSEPVGSSPADFREFMNADLAKWARLVKQSGAKSE